MKNIILSALVITFSFTVSFVPGLVSAASVDINRSVCKNVPGREKPSFCEDQVGDSRKASQNPIYGPNGIVTKVVNVLSMIVGIAAVIFIMVAGFRFIVSGSNSQEISQQREYILYALVALVIVALAQLMVRYVLLQIA